MGGTVRLHHEGPVAIITNDNPDRHNSFDDDMDGRLFEILDRLTGSPDVRAVVWRGLGPSFSSGRDVGSVEHMKTDISHPQLMRRVHDGARKLLDIDVPVIVSLHGWTIGVSFQRALLCDIRIAADDSRFRLPETGYGVIPDGGGVARLQQMGGHGIAADLVLTGRVMAAEEALARGVVSRLVPRHRLDDVALEMARTVAAVPPITVESARRVIGRLATPVVAASMEEEMVAQTVVTRSDEYRQWRRARR